jgi:hypothetical protein
MHVLLKHHGSTRTSPGNLIRTGSSRRNGAMEKGNPHRCAVVFPVTTAARVVEGSSSVFLHKRGSRSGLRHGPDRRKRENGVRVELLPDERKLSDDGTKSSGSAGSPGSKPGQATTEKV